MNINIFKYAAKKKLRFPYKGFISVEDLFVLDIEELNDVYKALKELETNSSEVSLIKERTDKDKDLEVQIAIVEEIFADKTKAIDRAKKSAEKKAQAQQILEIINKKQNEALENLSQEELEERLASLTDDVDDTDML